MERRISSSCGFVDTELGQRLAWPAIGLNNEVEVGEGDDDDVCHDGNAVEW